ncbi:helix-turn-helix domain-containing protein [Nocardia acidivorans]|uniref:helix-turn-helix domain-containing protein n=1 Tax=Nocardia acidivorans TaxID=404580 RepID=UPI0009FD08D1|nr:helix-turn-helix transcriptional regulator [Nocardia acidivorans]
MAGSTVSRRAFGKFLRELREQAHKSTLAVGLRIEVSRQTIMRLEDGLPTKVTTPQLEALLDFYGAKPKDRAEALELWAQVRQQAKIAKIEGTSKGWWQGFSGQYLSHFGHYLRLEAAANHMTTHQLVLVPGLMQASEYRRWIIRADDPHASVEEVDRALELLAIRRRERLDNTKFQLLALLSEAVLRHQPGPPEVMVNQLQHLVEDSERHNVSLRVIPFSAFGYSGLSVQSFTLMRFPLMSTKLVEPPVVYTEGSEGALYLERADVITRFSEAITNIERVALNEGDTRDLVLKIAKEYAA